LFDHKNSLCYSHGLFHRVITIGLPPCFHTARDLLKYLSICFINGDTVAAFRVYLALMTTIVFWASAFVGIRVGLTGYTPGSLALLRFLIASVCIAPIYSSMKILKPKQWRDRIHLLLLGMAGIGIYNICLNYGEISVSAGMASFIVGLMPVFTILMSVLLLKERQGPAVWFGILISFIGLFMIVAGSEGNAGINMGVLAIVISALMGAFYSFMSGHYYLKRFHPVAVTAWVMWGGTLMLLFFLPDMLHEIVWANAPATFSAIYMGIFPAALAYFAWSYALNHMPASKASVYLYALPLVSTLMGYIFLHEMPGLLALAGGTVALCGAFIANRSRSQSRQEVTLLDKNKSSATV